MFSGLSFLKGPMKVEDTAAEIIVGAAAAIGMVFFIIAGRLSDRVGRKKPIVWGYALTLLLLFPCFRLMGSAATPALDAAAERAPVVLTCSTCSVALVAAAPAAAGHTPPRDATPPGPPAR